MAIPAIAKHNNVIKEVIVSDQVNSSGMTRLPFDEFPNMMQSYSRKLVQVYKILIAKALYS